MKGTLSFAEVDASPEGSRALADFYRTVYVPEFPDPHERESLANMQRYLELKARGWYGANNYHVLIARRAQEVVGGCVFDYLARPNAGVLEFLFTRSDRRGEGIGRALLDATLRVLRRDARRGAKKPLAAVVAEMNDPFRRSATPDNMDPFERAVIWGGWGFGRFDFPYVQPALSRAQHPVTNLALVGRLRRGTPPVVRSRWLLQVVAEYMRWAMRISRPAANGEYRDMVAYARRHPKIGLVPLERYTGRDLPLCIEALHERHPFFPAALGLIESGVGGEGRVASREDFRAALRTPGYHLWSVSRPGTGRPGGAASFFALPRTGFGGYLVLERGLRGRGYLRPLLARIEEQMVRDAPRAEGWFIECDRRTCAPFLAVGFREVPIDYRPPRVGAGAGLPAERLHLLYKRFGAPDDTPAGRRFVLDGVADILRVVYRVRRPRTHTCYRLAQRSWRLADVR